MKLQWRGNDLKDMLWRAASATTMEEFKECMGYLKDTNEAAYEWLCQIPPQHWARSHFTGRAHTDMLLNNLCEVFNSKIVDGRDKPIITALEYLRTYMMRRMTTVQQMINKCDGPLTPTSTTILDKAKHDANDYKVLWNGNDKFEVSGPWMDQCVVNLNDKSCTCKTWELTGIPCKHAVAAIWYSKQGGTPEMWVLPVYWLDTWRAMYRKKIEPINGKKMWPKSLCPTKLLPPKHHVQVGRPKTKRIKARHEAAEKASKQRQHLSRKFMTVTCSKCGNKGHNARTCKGQGGGAGGGVAGGGRGGGGGVPGGSVAGGGVAGSARGGGGGVAGGSRGGGRGVPGGGRGGGGGVAGGKRKRSHGPSSNVQPSGHGRGGGAAVPGGARGAAGPVGANSGGDGALGVRGASRGGSGPVGAL